MKFLIGPNVKSLGKLPTADVHESDRYRKRKHEADAMPAQWLTPRPAGFVAAFRWITGYRELPVVKRPGAHPLDRKRGR